MKIQQKPVFWAVVVALFAYGCASSPKPDVYDKDGEFTYIDRSIEKPTHVDAPHVSFEVNFNQVGTSGGAIEVVAAPNLDLQDPYFFVAVDGDAAVNLSQRFFPASETPIDFFPGLRRKRHSSTELLPLEVGSGVIFETAVVMTGPRAVVSFALDERFSPIGEAVSLFMLKSGDRIYTGQSSFQELEIEALFDDYETNDMGFEEFAARVASLQFRPGAVTQTVFSAQALPPRQRQAAAGQITVRGNVQYTDRNGNTHAAEDVAVQIYDQNGANLDPVGQTRTQSNGDYTISIPDRDTANDGTGPDVVVKVIASGPLVDVKDIHNTVHAIQSTVQTDVASGSVLSVDFVANNSAANNIAFQTYDSIRRFAKYIGDTMPGPGPGKVDVEFPHNGLVCGGACYTGGVIYLPMHTGQNWDVMHHEYGHYLQDRYRLDNSPGGAHSIYENLCVSRASKSEGVRLSWSEGWATALGTIAQEKANMNALGIPFVNGPTYTSWKAAGGSWSIDLETFNRADPAQSGVIGECNETAVMRFLWDLFDSADDAGDTGLSYSPLSIWNAGVQIPAAQRPIDHFAEYWENFSRNMSEAENLAAGDALAEHRFGAENLTPADGFVYGGGAPLQFTWSPNLPANGGINGEFALRFIDTSSDAVLHTTPFAAGSAVSLTEAELRAIFRVAAGPVVWTPITRDTGAPQTGDYYGASNVLALNIGGGPVGNPPGGGTFGKPGTLDNYEIDLLNDPYAGSVEGQPGVNRKAVHEVYNGENLRTYYLCVADDGDAATNDTVRIAYNKTGDRADNRIVVIRETGGTDCVRLDARYVHLYMPGNGEAQVWVRRVYP